MIKKNIVIVTHKYLPQFPDDALVEYLNNNKYHHVLHIIHSFSDAKDRISRSVWYKNGKKVKTNQTIDYKYFPEIFIYIKEFLFTLITTIKSRNKWDVGIGMDGLCTQYIFPLKLSSTIKKIIYWSIDFVPENRFKSNIKNYIYRLVNTKSLLWADEVWDHTSRMVEQKEIHLGFTPANYKKHRVVPQGIWTDKLPKKKYSEINPYRIVFMGYILEKQGVQLIIKALPSIVKKYPSVEFVVIGEGPYLNDLIKLSKKNKVGKYCSFLGRVESNTEIEEIISTCAFAAAPYVRKLDTFTKFGGDPGKIKTYLGCGVPVLTTSVPWISREIDKNKCGVVSEEDKQSIVYSVEKLLDPTFNQECRRNALKFAKTFDNNRIFNQLNLSNDKK